MCQDGDYLYPGKYSQTSVDHRLDDTAFCAGPFSWQDQVHSWKTGLGEVMTVEKKHTKKIQEKLRAYCSNVCIYIAGTPSYPTPIL